jgi:16S rRNA (adenine1518-N6/adenine1519-N6)-dimethyltransferase
MNTYKKRQKFTENGHNRHDDYIEGMPRKKKSLGQHFLRKPSIVDRMIHSVVISPETSVVEIGCGDGFLTKAILQQSPCKNLFVFEIDPEWAAYVKNSVHDARLAIKLSNILEVDWQAELAAQKPLVLLANLPYQITFPIMYKLIENKNLFAEGVVMVQEEVAQKIVASSGKGYNPTSLLLQYHFEFKLLDKVGPESFSPPPKVDSRTLYFKPKNNLEEIPSEDEFWKFLRICFRQPRRNLGNNLKTAHYDTATFSADLLKKRAQELSFNDFLAIWKKLL